jgi:hypothetical protein
MAFSKQPQKYKHSFNIAQPSKRLITGPCMLPDRMIYRVNPVTNEEYYVYFSESTVEKISQIYSQKFYQKEVNIEHQQDIEDVCMTESWLVTDPKNDKANALGFDVPAGTWMVTFKCPQNLFDNYVKMGKVSGFSIEGHFIHNNQELFSNQELFDKKLITIERYQLGKNENHCPICVKNSELRNSKGGVWFLKGILPDPKKHTHPNCKCRLEQKLVKENPKNYK